ncbi:AEC family transporter [Paenibacillus sp.]|uniref:AEC family transporter n=1 Tax=Paenibacillus sp. TaxID=58172 RepID=UPI00281241AE|nr:AEC family transporter [Paenibacillus sp.]
MSVLALIVQEVMVPFFLLAGLGAFLQRRFRLDMGTLSKVLNIYLLPAVCFVKLYDSSIDAALAGATIGFWLLLNATVSVLSAAAVKAVRVGKEDADVVQNSFILSNQGNYGLPVSELVFAQHPLGVSVQVIISVIQNVFTYTFGTFRMIPGKGKQLAAALAVHTVRLPVIYAMLGAAALRMLDVRIPAILWEPVEGVSDAFFAIALLTLGAQLANVQAVSLGRSVLLGTIGRLLLAPAVAFALIRGFGWDGVFAQALFMASAYPVSRNSSLIALEYGRSPELAAQLVAVTTAISCITVTAVISLAQHIW